MLKNKNENLKKICIGKLYIIMPNYQNGIIYKIGAINGEYNHIYIGSTTKNTLRERFIVHKKKLRQFQGNFKLLYEKL